MARLNLALEGLVPIAWLDRLGRCADPRKPTIEEMWASDAEREELVQVLVMADVLAAGATTKKEHERAGSSLAALAKALVVLSLCPGGVKFMGQRYEVVADPTLRLKVAKIKPRRRASP